MSASLHRIRRPMAKSSKPFHNPFARVKLAPKPAPAPTPRPAAAREAVLSSARVEDKRSVLIVHGRGLHSQAQVPVLKEAVRAWRSTEKVRRQVVAFCTARPQDGGAGALYLLLQHR